MTTRTHANTRKHTHCSTLTYTHTHQHTNFNTHKHTHTYSLLYSLSFFFYPSCALSSHPHPSSLSSSNNMQVFQTHNLFSSLTSPTRFSLFPPTLVSCGFQRHPRRRGSFQTSFWLFMDQTCCSSLFIRTVVFCRSVFNKPSPFISGYFPPCPNYLHKFVRKRYKIASVCLYFFGGWQGLLTLVALGCTGTGTHWLIDMSFFLEVILTISLFLVG